MISPVRIKKNLVEVKLKNWVRIVPVFLKLDHSEDLCLVKLRMLGKIPVKH